MNKGTAPYTLGQEIRNASSGLISLIKKILKQGSGNMSAMAVLRKVRSEAGDKYSTREIDDAVQNIFAELNPEE